MFCLFFFLLLSMDSFCNLPLFLVLFFTVIISLEVYRVSTSYEVDAPVSHALSRPNDTFFSGGDFDYLEILMRKALRIMNGIGWGILMPIGAMIACSLKAFDSARSTLFQLHRTCQFLAYFTGMTGFALGIYMGNHYIPIHGYIGITIILVVVAQILVALFFKPCRHHETFLSIFHRVVRHVVIELAKYNMFSGFHISNSYQKWRKAYFIVIVSLSCMALTLEVITWFVVCKRKKMEEGDSEESLKCSEEHHEMSLDDKEIP